LEMNDCASSVSIPLFRDPTIVADYIDGVNLDQIKEKIIDYHEDITEQCLANFFDAISTGLKLVFGENASPGHICGIKDAIKEDKRPVPGTCCLDAPFELDGDNWGHKVRWYCFSRDASSLPAFGFLTLSA